MGLFDATQKNANPQGRPNRSQWLRDLWYAQGGDKTPQGAAYASSRPANLSVNAFGARVGPDGKVLRPAPNPADQASRDAWKNGGWQKEQADRTKYFNWRADHPIQNTEIGRHPDPGEDDYYAKAALFNSQNAPQNSPDSQYLNNEMGKYWTKGADGSMARNSQLSLRPDGSVDPYGSTGMQNGVAIPSITQPIAPQGAPSAPPQGGTSTPEERASIWNPTGGPPVPQSDQRFDNGPQMNMLPQGMGSLLRFLAGRKGYGFGGGHRGGPVDRGGQLPRSF